MARKFERSEEPKRLYGFLDSVGLDGLPGDGYRRNDLTFEAVDADAFDRGDAQAGGVAHLSMVRVLSTPKRLSERFGVGDNAKEGAWFSITLAPERGEPLAWEAPATTDYVNGFQTNVTELTLLGGAGDPADATAKKLKELMNWCAPRRQVSYSATIDQLPKTELHVRVVDVGQANCAAIHAKHDANSPILGYYDVGAPIFFHRHTMPKSFKEPGRIPKIGFVVLSHWDYDHYSLAITDMKQLQQLDWYAPFQDVGPIAAKLQKALGANLHFINSPQFSMGNGLALHKGTAPADDRNGSGYAMSIDQNGHRALLTGDVSYQWLDNKLKTGLSALAISHHGGRGCENPPAPATNGKAVASYGLGNRYRHPIKANIDAHDKANWLIERTAEHNGFSRSDRWLT